MSKKNWFSEELSGFHIKDFYQGRLISHDWLLKHWKKIAVVMILLLVYISNRYTCQQKIAEIGRLQRELTEKRYEALSISSKLMGTSRQSQVKMLIDNQGLDLEESNQPPFKLSR